MAKFDEKATWPGWETVRLIGRGSFGAVYEIQRSMYGHTEKAALKVLRIPQSQSDIDELYSDGFDEESITARFHGYLEGIVREYLLMADMKGCRNVVYCDDLRQIPHEDGIGWDIYIKMELLTPLTKTLDKDISEETALRVGIDICNALVKCRELKIVHRDIKPQNIFVSDDGTYKLGDFGIAKTAEKTSGGTKTGTYKYMAPEVYNNQPYGAAADQYSLGIVLYWLLNERRTPFLPLPSQVKATTVTMEDEARARRMNGEPVPPPAHGSDALKAIVMKACAFNPKDRFASAAEMLAALEAVRTGAPATIVRQTAPVPAARRAEPQPVAYQAPRQVEDDVGEGTVGVFGRSGQTVSPAPSAARTERPRPAQPIAPASIPYPQQQPEDGEEEGTVGVFAKTATERPTLRPKASAPARPAVQQTPPPAVQQTAPPVQPQTATPAQPEPTPTPKKKKPFWLLIPAAAVIALVVLLATGVLGGGKTPREQEYIEGDWTWTLENGVLTISGTGNMKNFEHSPDVPWSEQRDSITRIVIEEGITGIGDTTFFRCENVTSVEIPSGVTVIGDYAFYSCRSLPGVTIPEGVTSIGANAFAFCDELTDVTIPSSVRSIGEAAFLPCDKLEGIHVDAANRSYTSVDGVLFTKDKTVLIQCPAGLSSYVIPEGVTGIGDYAFYNSRCELTSVTIPSGVKSIGNWAFESCEHLTSVTIPSGVTDIGKSAFRWCSELTVISIPASVKSIGVFAFAYCRNIGIVVEQGNKQYVSVDGVLFNKDQTELLQCPAGLSSYVIPEGVTTVRGGAFTNCILLKSVNIPASVTSIGEWAFDGCDQLGDVYYGGSQDQWSQVTVGEQNDYLINAPRIHYNSN